MILALPLILSGILLFTSASPAPMASDGEPANAADGEPKVRVPLDPIPVEKRSSLHVATVLLGEMNASSRARVAALAPEELEAGFSAGAIPQESWYGPLAPLVRDWARRPAYRLDGAADLDGAVAVLGRLCRGETV